MSKASGLSFPSVPFSIFQAVLLPLKTSRNRRATISASPGCICHTPIPISCFSALAGDEPGAISIDGLPSRSCLRTSSAVSGKAAFSQFNRTVGT